MCVRECGCVNANDGDEDDVESAYRMTTREGSCRKLEIVCRREREKERGKERTKGRERKEENVYVCVCVCVREKAKKKEMRFGTRALYLYV